MSTAKVATKVPSPFIDPSDGKTKISSTTLRLGLMVRGSNVKLFINCEHVETLSVTRPQSIEFDPASSLYIGQGGSKFKKPWEGIIQVVLV